MLKINNQIIQKVSWPTDNEVENTVRPRDTQILVPGKNLFISKTVHGWKKTRKSAQKPLNF